MGILSAILLSPLAPVRGVIALGEVIQRHAEEELYNPANTRRQLRYVVKSPPISGPLATAIAPAAITRP
jgi:hypothetical protein